MVKNKNKTQGKNEKNKKKLPVSTGEEEIPPKKMKTTPKDTEVSECASSKVESIETKDVEDLTPEERRILERKVKKERKKEEKRLKRERKSDEEEEEEPSKPSACELSLQYLRSWSEKRKDWKFQKTRQTWLLLHMYDRDKVSDEDFPILLDYLGGLKGSARDTTVKKSEALMKAYDEHEEQEELDLQKMSRIREVLQLLT